MRLSAGRGLPPCEATSTLPSATAEVAKSSTTGSSFGPGKAAANGATRALPDTLTKCTETSPDSTACSARSPMRPRWPARRRAITATPFRVAISTPSRTRRRPSRLPEAVMAVENRKRLAARDDLGFPLGDEVPVSKPPQIARHPDHAVAVVPCQIRAHEVEAHAPALGLRTSGRSENSGDKGFKFFRVDAHNASFTLSAGSSSGADAVEPLPVEGDAVAWAARGQREAVLDPERVGDVALQAEAVRLQVRAVRAGGEEMHRHVMGAVAGDRQVERLREPGDFHEGGDAAAVSHVGLGIAHASARNVELELPQGPQVLARRDRQP